MDVEYVCKNRGLLFRFVNLHPHFLVQRGDFVNFTGMLGDFVIQILAAVVSNLQSIPMSLHLNDTMVFHQEAFIPERKFIDIDTL